MDILSSSLDRFAWRNMGRAQRQSKPAEFSQAATDAPEPAGFSTLSIIG
jgi:hypothetical protein